MTGTLIVIVLALAVLNLVQLVAFLDARRELKKWHRLAGIAFRGRT